MHGGFVVNCGVKSGLPSNHLWVHPQSHGHMKLISQGHIVKADLALTRQKSGSTFWIGVWSPPMSHERKGLSKKS
jgi:hypothetical protein